VKSLRSTEEWHPILAGLRNGEASGILGVEVECVDIEKNSGGEGGSLDTT
jgi:hypothetical protein